MCLSSPACLCFLTIFVLFVCIFVFRVIFLSHLRKTFGYSWNVLLCRCTISVIATSPSSLKIKFLCFSSTCLCFLLIFRHFSENFVLFVYRFLCLSTLFFVLDLLCVSKLFLVVLFIYCAYVFTYPLFFFLSSFVMLIIKLCSPLIYSMLIICACVFVCYLSLFYCALVGILYFVLMFIVLEVYSPFFFSSR